MSSYYIRFVLSSFQTACGISGPRQSSFLDKIDHTIRAFLLARATATTFGCRHSRIRLIQTLLASCFPPAFPRTALAPWIKSVRKYRSPRLLIPNNRDLPPLDLCLGTSPSHAANWRPFLKQDWSPTAATRVLSDECEPVSARTMKLSLMPRQVGATQRERRCD